ncbi:DUF2695 domain-containing protein [Spelaeicoccus albus]|uniref:DUF2695 domain-containing protein n=1 Tax=Spelaeicoccus albus TaxID=1280376 RepID=UPI003556E738
MDRMLDEFGCDNTLRFALRFRDQVAPRAPALGSSTRVDSTLWQLGQQQQYALVISRHQTLVRARRSIREH